MRIVFVDFICDPAKPGRTGLSDLVWDMAKRLAHLGDEVHVVAPYTTEDAPDSAVHVHRFPIPPIGYRNIAGHVLIVLAAYRRLLGLGRFDVVHVPEYLSAAILGTLLKNSPVVLTEPGNIFERVANGNPYDGITTEVLKVAARRAAASCARLIATSQEMASWWEQTGFSRERIVRIPLGVDAHAFRRAADAKAILGWSASEPAVLFAARLSRENGADTAARAVAKLVEQGHPVQFHVLGDGPEAPALMELLDSLNIARQTTLHGWVDLGLLQTYYSAADVFIFSGQSGGTPRVLLQAMSCGTPVIASRIGGIIDHVTDGETGLLFTPGDSGELAEKIASLLQHPNSASQIGQAGEQYVRRELDCDVLVGRLRTVYQDLAS